MKTSELMWMAVIVMVMFAFRQPMEAGYAIQPTTTTTLIMQPPLQVLSEEDKLDAMFSSAPQFRLPTQSACDVVNCPLSNEDFYVPPYVMSQAEDYAAVSLEDAFMKTRSLDREYKMSCGKSSLMLLAMLKDINCDYRVYHLINMVTESVGHSFVGIETDGRFLILDPLNCHSDDMYECIAKSTSNFYANEGVTRKDTIIAEQLVPYACKYTPPTEVLS
jgi:hypothetical protein